MKAGVRTQIILLILYVAARALTSSGQTLNESLRCFWDTTGGASWRLSTNWNTGASVCSWHGIACKEVSDPAPRNVVITLQLSSNGMTGSFFNSVACLSVQAQAGLAYLTTFDVNGNSMEGPVPESIGLFTELLRLDVSSNRLTGDLPPSIYTYRKLSMINLYSNSLVVHDFLTKISDMTSLTYIGFGSNYEFTGTVPTSIAKLTKLTQLWIDTTAFTGTIPDVFLLSS